MTARTVQGFVEFPVGSGIPCVGARTTVTLYSGVDGNITYGTANDITVGGTAALSNNSGYWSLDLEPNDNITPAGTVWQITTTPPDRAAVSYYIDVPDTAGPHDVTDILADPPGALPSQALAAHTALTSAHGTTGAVVGTTSTQTLTNKTLTDPVLSLTSNAALAARTALTAARRSQFNVADYADIHAAITAANSAGGGTVVLSTVGATAITSTVTVPTGVGLRMEPGSYLSVPTSVAVAVLLDTPQYTKAFVGLDIRRVSHNWDGASPTDSSSIGLKIRNARTATIDVARVENFCTNILFQGDTTGSSYNTLLLGGVLQAKVGVEFSAINAGWANENTVIGGRVTTSFDDGAGNPVAGSRLFHLGGNNIRLYGVSMEGDAPERSIYFAAEADYCIAHNCRFEDASPVEFATGSSFNTVDYGYGVFGYNAEKADEDVPDDEVRIIDDGLRNRVNGVYGIMSYSSNQRGRGTAFLGLASGSNTLEFTFEGKSTSDVTTFSVNGAGDVIGNSAEWTTYARLLPVTDLGSATAGKRGRIAIREADGVEDKVCVCVRTSAGGYKWINLVDGSTVT